jgi:23S rRNA (pseudouridine1915-N3)-methyltransferase
MNLDGLLSGFPMELRFIWPGKTKNPGARALQEFYLARIRPMASSSVLETREARGLTERAAAKILDVEARGLEDRLDGNFVICLADEGKEMTSVEFARFLLKRAAAPARPSAFVVGGFLGLAGRVLERADLRLSLSRMTFSHEMARVVLLEQIYRSLTIMKGTHYAK